MERRRTHWAFLGQVEYAAGVELQHQIRAGIKAGTGGEHLLLLEHPPVFTLGRNAAAVDILAPPDWLEQHGVEVYESDRGGQVTYHGPGQLVGYPVIDLSPDRRDIRRYVRDLQEVLIRTLADFGLTAERHPDPGHIGVWVGGGKIASLGVHLSRWITTHGFALNVSTNLGHFDGIVACGLQGVRMVSIEALTGARPGLAEVAARVAHHFAVVYDRELVPLEESPLEATG